MARRIDWVTCGRLLLLAAVFAPFTACNKAEPPPPEPAKPKKPAYVVRTQAERGRDILFAELQPVKLANCELARYGEANDGGYVLCRNLTREVRSAYSYGISGYDGWGCQVSTELKVPVHQYDCFNLQQPSCPTGRPRFHGECIAPEYSKDSDGRVFDSLQNQLKKNGDAGKHVIVKMDVEGAEWESIQKTPDSVFENIDQMIFEFHGAHRDVARYLDVVLKLKKFFHVVHLHFNNFSCQRGLEPFPAWAYEVTFVNKRLGVVDPAGVVTRPSSLDAPNNPGGGDCQAVPAR